MTVPLAAAEPEYATIRMEIEVARPAPMVWAKVGKYCDIREWLNVQGAKPDSRLRWPA